MVDICGAQDHTLGLLRVQTDTLSRHDQQHWWRQHCLRHVLLHWLGGGLQVITHLFYQCPYVNVSLCHCLPMSQCLCRCVPMSLCPHVPISQVHPGSPRGCGSVVAQPAGGDDRGGGHWRHGEEDDGGNQEFQCPRGRNDATSDRSSDVTILRRLL